MPGERDDSQGSIGDQFDRKVGDRITDEMTRAGGDVIIKYDGACGLRGDPDEIAREVYQAMVARYPRS